MELRLEFAVASQGTDLEEILRGHGMGLAGDIGEHVVAMEQDQVFGGGLLCQLDQDLFHLLVLGVASDRRGTGIGKLLLAAMCRNPWRYCLDSADRLEGPYRITTMARGEAVPFYRKCGFQTCDAQEIPAVFAEQCDDCPSREECRPAPMLFIGTCAAAGERNDP